MTSDEFVKAAEEFIQEKEAAEQDQIREEMDRLDAEFAELNKDEPARKPGQIFVCSGGRVSSLYTDDLKLKDIGAVATKRASHVDGSADLSVAAFFWLLRNRRELWPAEETYSDTANGAEEYHRLLAMLDPGMWWADLQPSNGPVLGPFETRQEALDAEVAWLRVNLFHVQD